MSRSTTENQDKINYKKSKTEDYALQLAGESKPIMGTLAEKYLKEIREIHNISGENIRFHPKVYTHKSEAIKIQTRIIKYC